MRFITRVLGNMAGLWAAAQWVPGVEFFPSPDTWNTLLNLFLIALLLAAVNSIIRPVIRLLTFPLYILTLGLFTFVTNGLVFSTAAWLSGHMRLPLEVSDFPAAIIGGTVVAIVAAVVASVLGLLLPKSSRS